MSGWQKRDVTAPAINVIENDKDYKVEMAAPGMTKDDFKVNVDENNNLTICMEKKEREEGGEERQEVSPPRILIFQVPADHPAA